MSDFNSPKNTLPDLMPLEDDRSSQVLPQELDAIRMSLMETSWRTKQIVDVLIRHNSLLERDIEKITNLKRRLRRSIGIIPGMPGRAGALFGVGVAAGFLPMGGGGIKPAQPFIFPPRVRRKPPRPQEDPVRVKDPVRVTDDVREDVKEDVREDVRVRVPDAETQTNEQISGTAPDWVGGLEEIYNKDGSVIEKELAKGDTKTNEQRSGTSIWDVPITPGLYPGLEDLLDNDGIGSDIFNPNNPQPAFNWQAFMAMEKGLNIQELEKVDKGINWRAVFDWVFAIGMLATPFDAGIAGDLAGIANLLMKGRITWGFLARFIGKKGVEKIYNYFMQKGIEVPQPNWNLGSINNNSSSFNIASASDTVNSDGLHSHTRKKDVFVFITDKPPIA